MDRLNPLHCGAVVASTVTVGKLATLQLPVSIPFIAGQWSLPPAAGGRGFGERTSQSPSLRGSGRFTRTRRPRTRTRRRLNPLHCGAVVASGPPRDIVSRGDDRLNPLHCGAVVASQGQEDREQGQEDVSIPFIAGQWSLQAHLAARRGGKEESQSPSLRGSGRFGIGS